MTLANVFRISTALLLLLVKEDQWVLAKPRQIKPGCRYEGRRYQEGTMVSTTEPCLQCRCTEGALRCRLRVCPRLPNPAPSGCHVREPPENVCCAELVCGDSRDAENVLRRADAQIDAEDEEVSHSSRSQGCLHDGVRYAPGSAMTGSKRCEYCYCISGERRCIRPKCLLPLPGCTPLYAPHSCCPVAYNCTHQHLPTAAPVSGNVTGCRVGDRAYNEGEMVRDIRWKAACDNCFCAMAAIRCVPLACAPPLRGCSPIVRQGQCCPSTYNCSGSIEVNATQNYASYAFISKDYAKFRKETNFIPAVEHTTNSATKGRGHRVVDEGIDTSTIDFEAESSTMAHSTSWPSTYETEIMDNEIMVETTDYAKSTFAATTTTPLPCMDELSTNTESTVADPTTTTRDAEATVEIRTIAQYSTDLATDSLPTTTINASSSEDTVTATAETTVTPTEWVTDTRTLGEKPSREPEDDAKVEHESSSSDFANTTSAADPSEEEQHESTFDRENGTVTEATGKGAVTSPSSTVLVPDDILVMNVTVKTNVSVGHIQGVTINPIRSIPPDVEAILNITHRENADEYEYDYSEPTLPPSLPNVRIIPFVAADALVKDKDATAPVTGYVSGSAVVPAELRPTDNSGYYDIATQENRFSPPIETEGGFVPREPPYFDAPFHSTDLSLKIGTGVTVVPAPTTNPHRKNDELPNNCAFENREYRHGELLPSSRICIICMCYYGEVVCSAEKCPPLKIGCRRVSVDEGCCGKIVCVDAVESPTVVLDRADATAASQQRQPTVSPDPFRDVIKTEPAPDLPSLIEDMIPYLVEHGITTPRPTTPMTTPLAVARSPSSEQRPEQRPEHEQSVEFVEEVPLIRPPFGYGDETIGEGQPATEHGLGHAEASRGTSPASHRRKDADRTPDHRADSTPEAEPFTRDPVTLARTDLATTRADARVRVHASVGAGATDDAGAEDSSAKIASASDSEPESPVDEASEVDGTVHAEDYVFSLGGVFDLLFASEASSKSPETAGSAKVAESTESTGSTGTTGTTGSTGTTGTTGTTGAIADESVRVSSTTVADGTSHEDGVVAETPSKMSDNEISGAVAGLLKLAGCNIQGRMYRVGKIIGAELSGPCRECRCTEIGVQCRQLEC